MKKKTALILGATAILSAGIAFGGKTKEQRQPEKRTKTVLTSDTRKKIDNFLKEDKNLDGAILIYGSRNFSEPDIFFVIESGKTTSNAKTLISDAEVKTNKMSVYDTYKELVKQYGQDAKISVYKSKHSISQFAKEGDSIAISNYDFVDITSEVINSILVQKAMASREDR